MRQHVVTALVCVLLLSACEKPGQNTYNANEVGVSRTVEFGTVVSVREVNIINKNSGAGVLAGGAAGAVGGSTIGRGNGSILGAIGGALAGAVAGDFIEHKIQDSKGYEYVLYMRDGKSKTITEEKIEGDEVFKPGDKVMLQTCDTDHQQKCKSGAQFQRLTRVDAFPPEPHRSGKVITYKKVDEDDTDE